MIVKSKWRGVLEEYDSSSYLHHFVKDDSEDIKSDHKEDGEETATETKEEKGPEDPSNLSNISDSFMTRYY